MTYSVYFQQIFQQINLLFDNIKKNLFADEWIYNETKLIFIYKDIKASPKPYFVYYFNDKESYILKKYKSDNTIKTIFDNKCKDRQYIYDVSMSNINNYVFMFCCACVSPCFENNHGRLLLTKAFKEMLALMQDWYRKLGLNILNRSAIEEIDNMDSFAALILNRASEETCHCMENFYAPIRFAYITSLSGEYYEKASCQASLIFIPCSIDIGKYAEIFSYDLRKIEQEKMILSFENLRVIRKLLQIAQEQMCLLFHENKNKNFYAVGICPFKKFLKLLNKNDEKIPYFNVKIKQHMDFDIFIGDNYIFSYRNGKHKIRYQIPDKYLFEICQKTFYNDMNYSKIIKTINEARKQSHGTMLVILSEDDALKETKRLADNGYGMINNNYSKATEDILHLSAIDGSIISDVNGIVYGIGMILDGSPEVKGDIAKGARHNSAYKYCKYLQENKIKGLIYIVSEDGDSKLLISDF